MREALTNESSYIVANKMGRGKNNGRAQRRKQLGTDTEKARLAQAMGVGGSVSNAPEGPILQRADSVDVATFFQLCCSRSWQEVEAKTAEVGDPTLPATLRVSYYHSRHPSSALPLSLGFLSYTRAPGRLAGTADGGSAPCWVYSAGKGDPSSTAQFPAVCQILHSSDILLGLQMRF